MEARMHRLSIPTSSLLAALLLVAAFVALATAILVDWRSSEPLLARTGDQTVQPTFVPTGLGRAYDDAAARLVRTNHELESRQARLSVALRRGAEPARVQLLRRQVRALEREYASTVAALGAVADSSARR
jgi:hypothetical protein